GQRAALLDVDAHLGDDVRELLVLGLLAQDRQRAQQRKAGVDHRRELAREDRDVLQLDPVGEPRDADVGREAGSTPLLDADGRVAHRAELAGDERLALGLELALDRATGPVADLVLERRRHRPLLSAPTPRSSRAGAGPPRSRTARAPRPS